MGYFQRTAFLAVMLCLAFPFSALSGTTSTRQDEAIQAAKSFLKLVDRGDYDQSWEEASSLLISLVSKKEWVETLSGVRPPLGQSIQRSVTSSKFMSSAPGVPDGEYAKVVFSSSFDHKESAVETVMTMLDKDGRWRVAGYFIK